jgi:uncharacterized cupredoxin-like copper-binding protein
MRGRIVPLLMAALAAAPAAAQTPGWANARPLTVELSSFRFAPSAISLQHGTAYRLHLVNKSSGGHDFVAREFFAGSTIAADDRAKIRKGAIDVDGGEAVDILLIPNQTGTFKLRCSHFMHSTFGMTGTIVVQ